jgi:hypothetical protein
MDVEVQFIGETEGLAVGLQALGTALVQSPYVIVHFVHDGPQGRPGWLICRAAADPELVKQLLAAFPSKA